MDSYSVCSIFIQSTSRREEIFFPGYLLPIEDDNILAGVFLEAAKIRRGKVVLVVLVNNVSLSRTPKIHIWVILFFL